MTDAGRLLKELSQRPIAYYPIYAEITESVTAGIVLSQIMYWYYTMGREFYKTDEDFAGELKMGLKTFRNAKKNLISNRIIIVKLKGIPPKTHYIVDVERIEKLIISYSDNSNLPQKDKLNCPKGIERDSQKGQNITEITTEITTETTTDIYIPENPKNNNNINEELINRVLTTWNNQQHLTTHNLSTVTRKFQKKHIDAIRDIGLDKVLKSIVNYDKIVGDPDMWYDYRFSLWDFIVKALERFLDEAKPFENYRMKKKNFEQKKEFKDPYSHPDRERERIDDIDV